jgi:hypothetical protein
MGYNQHTNPLYFDAVYVRKKKTISKIIYAL